MTLVQSTNAWVVGLQPSFVMELELTGSGSMGMTLMGTETVGMRSLGMPIAGVRARGTTSPFCGVRARLGVAQTGCGGGVGLLDEAGLCAQGATSSPDGVTVGSGSARCFNAVT